MRVVGRTDGDMSLHSASSLSSLSLCPHFCPRPSDFLQHRVGCWEAKRWELPSAHCSDTNRQNKQWSLTFMFLSLTIYKGFHMPYLCNQVFVLTEEQLRGIK